MDDDRLAGVLAAAVAAGAGAPSIPGLDGSVQVVVTGTDSGDVNAALTWADGRLVEARAGAPTSPVVTWTIGAADARAVGAGELDPSVAFMQGRLKTSGDNGLVLLLLAATSGPAYRLWLDFLRVDQ